jgi:putative ATP-dependent endonuclease of OLD family
MMTFPKNTLIAYTIYHILSMKITKIRAKNFRLLKDSTLNLRDDLSLLIGRNNSGKTSLIVLLEKFMDGAKFNIYDYPTAIRENIFSIDEKTPNEVLEIQLYMQIKYEANDDLSDLAELIPDIDSSISTVNFLFEANIDKNALLSSLENSGDKSRYILKNLDKHTSTKFYVFEDSGVLDYVERENLIEKDIKLIKNLINLEIIHAKRNVSSSEEFRKESKVLSSLTTKFFKSNNGSPEKAFQEINTKMAEMDANLNLTYQAVFEPFLKNAKDFLKLTDLRVISDIQSNELISDTSQVVYGDLTSTLPEHLNGLGVMNVLFLLLQIEMKKESMSKAKKQINILIIEEPEAHTHPQMQYVFTSQIKKIISEIRNLQTLITTHSSHIVSQCDFKDIRYLKKTDDNNIEIKNFYDELRGKYSEEDHFQFLVQYLTIQSSELFFADKIIFIEGTVERILLPYFIRQHDKSLDPATDIPLSAQHISVMEVGANAKVFSPFLDFLGIKTLIITDLDSTVFTQPSGNTKSGYSACSVSKSTHTSNYSLQHFYAAPEFSDAAFLEWYKDLKSGKLSCVSPNIHVAFQCEDAKYHPRSFEDAFIHINRSKINANIKHLSGLKNKYLFEDPDINSYDLTENTLAKKSDFASSILYLALAGNIGKRVEWKTPLYIKEALEWLAK